MSKIVPPTKKYLDSLVDPFLTNQPDGLAFVIGYVGPTFHDIYFKGNLANQFGKKIALGKDTYFELASVSKTFTATLSAVLGAQYQGPPVPGDPPAWLTQTIENYLTIGSQFNSIPLSTLLSYSSGLPADNDTVTDLPPELPIPYSPAGMLGYLSMTPLIPEAPNSAYRYSNLGFSIMAQIAPLFKSGSPPLPDFSTLMSERVLDPLGMNDTFFFEDLSIDEFALGYSYYSAPKTPVGPGWPGLSAYNGAGGVVSTPKDMLTWLRYNMGLINTKKTENLTAILPLLQSPATDVLAFGDYQLGLSWFLSLPSLPNDLPQGVWKDGEIIGTNTFIEFLPWVSGTGAPSEAGVFVLTNSDSLSLGGNEVVATIATDVLITMQGNTPPTDKSRYPRVFGR
jgi:D-alanyl-D-alanine-carboxypeptidase/D-alanyl-D-alanine-endopeptidase